MSVPQEDVQDDEEESRQQRQLDLDDPAHSDERHDEQEHQGDNGPDAHVPQGVRGNLDTAPGAAELGRKGFSADLKVLATASSEDFMEAMNIAKPNESITAACARPDMPAKVKTAIRTLLLNTSDVPGTEGRKTQLRYIGHGNKLLVGASSFFVTPKFADTYSPLVLQLHEGLVGTAT